MVLLENPRGKFEALADWGFVFGSSQPLYPWCVTYAFSEGNYMYNCEVLWGGVRSVQPWSDWSSTALIDSTFSIEINYPFPDNPMTISAAPSGATSTPAHHVLSGGAIGGIAAGAAVFFLAVVLGVIALFYFRRRRKQAGYAPPPARSTLELNDSSVLKDPRTGMPMHLHPQNQTRGSVQEMPTLIPNKGPWELHNG